jgi:hypothetical protein
MGNNIRSASVLVSEHWAPKRIPIKNKVLRWRNSGCQNPSLKNSGACENKNYFFLLLFELDFFNFFVFMMYFTFRCYLKKDILRITYFLVMLK